MQGVNQQMLKRTFDFSCSLVGLLLLSPLFVIVGVLIKFTSQGPAFYRAARVGYNGKPFKLYKFRTMIVDADKIGPAVTTQADSRITPIGRILRRTKLDEIPQVINVVVGDMSLVGPRPESSYYVNLYSAEQRKILTFHPGLTSPASLYYRNEENLLTGKDWEEKYIKEIMPHKLEMDLTYALNSNLSTDLLLILKTLFYLITRSNSEISR